MNLSPAKAQLFTLTGTHEEQRQAMLLFLKSVPNFSLFVDCERRISKALSLPTDLPWVLYVGHRDIGTIISVLQEIQRSITLKYVVIDPINSLSNEHQALFIFSIHFLFPHLVFFFLFESKENVLMHDVQKISQYQIMEVLQP